MGRSKKGDMTPPRMGIKRVLWLTQEFNERIRKQHERLIPRGAHPSLIRFMSALMESTLQNLEREEREQNLVVSPSDVPRDQAVKLSETLEEFRKRLAK